MQRYRDFAISFSQPLPEVDIANGHYGSATCDLSEQQEMDKTAHFVYETVNLAKLTAPVQWRKWTSVAKQNTPP
jgi:hypothetical protein